MVAPLLAWAGSKAAGRMYERGYSGGRGSKLAKVGSFLLDPGGFLDPGGRQAVEWSPTYGGQQQPSVGIDPEMYRRQALAQGALAQPGTIAPQQQRQYTQSQQQQLDMMRGLAQQAQTGESAALTRQQELYDRLRSQQQSALASNVSLSAGQRARMGDLAAGELHAQQQQQEALLKAQTQTQAAQQLAQFGGQARGLEQQAALERAGLQQQAGQFNAAQMQALMGAMMSDEVRRRVLQAQSQQQLGMGYDEMALQKAMAEAGMGAQAGQQAAAGGKAALGSLLGGLFGRR